MSNERKPLTRTVCINQLFRPKMKIPKWMSPKGRGDCTTCKPCSKNLKCSCYTPVGLILIEEK